MNIEEIKLKLIDRAMQTGHDDAFFAISERGTHVLFLFLKYGFSEEKIMPGQIPVSTYYLTSQKGYTKMKEMLAFCAQEKINAEEYKDSGVKKLAVSNCGEIGRNSLYYHPKLGCSVSIHCIEILGSVKEQEKRAIEAKNNCRSCTLCEKICPTGAISRDGHDSQKCLREYLTKKNIPPKYARQVYQIMGCELCMTVCPKNNFDKVAATTFSIEELLAGEKLKELGVLIGKNNARRRIILGQTICYALNTQYLPALKRIEELTDDEFVGEIATYAKEHLKKIDEST